MNHEEKSKENMAGLGLIYSPGPTDECLARVAATPRGEASAHFPDHPWLPAACREILEWRRGYRVSRAHLERIEALESARMAAILCLSHWRDCVFKLCGFLGADVPTLPDPKSVKDGAEWVPYAVVLRLLEEATVPDQIGRDPAMRLDDELGRWWEGFHETERVRRHVAP